MVVGIPVATLAEVNIPTMSVMTPSDMPMWASVSFVLTADFFQPASVISFESRVAQYPLSGTWFFFVCLAMDGKIKEVILCSISATR